MQINEKSQNLSEKLKNLEDKILETQDNKRKLREKVEKREKEIHSKVSSTLESMNIKDIPILYGGSVNSANSNQIINANNVDGVLVGGASTNFDQLTGIINSI